MYIYYSLLYRFRHIERKSRVLKHLKSQHHIPYRWTDFTSWKHFSLFFFNDRRNIRRGEKGGVVNNVCKRMLALECREYANRDASFALDSSALKAIPGPLLYLSLFFLSPILSATFSLSYSLSLFSSLILTETLFLPHPHWDSFSLSNSRSLFIFFSLYLTLWVSISIFLYLSLLLPLFLSLSLTVVLVPCLQQRPPPPFVCNHSCFLWKSYPRLKPSLDGMRGWGDGEEGARALTLSLRANTHMLRTLSSTREKAPALIHYPHFQIMFIIWSKIPEIFSFQIF